MNMNEITRFEDTFARRQDAAERRKVGVFHTNKTARIKLFIASKDGRKMIPQDKKKIGSGDKRIKKPSYLRRKKKIKTKKDGGKDERFKTRAKDRMNKLQFQIQYEDN